MLPELSAAGMLVARKALIPIDNILGAWVIGLIISSAIWGVTGLQIYHYFTKFSTRDGPFLKSFVCALFLVDTLHLSLISEAFYVAAITNFGDYLSLGEVTWSQIAQIPVGVIMGTMVQLFYAYRIWLLGNRSPWIPAAIVVSSLGEFAIAIVYTHKAVQVKFYVDAAADLPYATTSLALELACDIFIAFGMVFNLLRTVDRKGGAPQYLKVLRRSTLGTA
ncbi:hypothetical protein HMN09_00661500 [Mycena chlorophos]|uniref:Uncharacterized protein n=1 Tax=Mycena chlorophos TaxID=658473 RepID=A0A8H6WD81_MYCCL|nr:hypothetical protein HMN09_00661500 [Mycena chlorophos]